MKWKITIDCECVNGNDAASAMHEAAEMVDYNIGPEPMRETSGAGFFGFPVRRNGHATCRWAITRAENDSPPLPESQSKGAD